METKDYETAPAEVPVRSEDAVNVKPIEELLARLGPKAVYGDPVQVDQVTVIPVAEVRTGFGFGGGRGRTARAGSQGDVEEGGGSGGGGGGRVVPRGYIRIGPDGVRFEPILDVTRLALASFAFAAFAVYAITKALGRD